MKSFISWIGGKSCLLHEILPRFPSTYGKYVEVFGGGASVLFALKPKDKFEVYNDYQSDLVNLFSVVKNKPISFLEMLGYLPLHSRVEFKNMRELITGRMDHFTSEIEEEIAVAKKLLDPIQYEEVKELLTKKASPPDVVRAVTYFKLIKQSYGSGGKTFGARPLKLTDITSIILNASNRLKHTIIENKDFEALILHYDRDDTFFYCDPPYFLTEGHYEAVFSSDDHQRLHDVLSNIKGKFLLSYNDCEFIKELYKDFYIVEVSRLNNLAQRYDAGATYEELLIANYDIEKQFNSSQMTLF